LINNEYAWRTTSCSNIFPPPIKTVKSSELEIWSLQTSRFQRNSSS
jgi:hypothetical protein